MNIRELRLAGLLLCEPTVHRDGRGYFLETWNADRYRECGLVAEFVQDNTSFSRRGVIRGLHYQRPRTQGKLVTVFHGSVFDVAVDLRADSPTFGEWEAVELTADNALQLWLPPGFAHGFQATSEAAVVSYKCTDIYTPACERTVRWDDPEIGVRWPVGDPMLSEKDARAPLLRELPAEHLFGEWPLAEEVR